MNYILWNRRGANKPNFRRSVRYILKKFPTDVLALFETHASGDRAQQICQGVGFDNSFRVDAVGQCDGLWLLWKSVVGDVVIVDSTEQYIHARIEKDEEVMHLVVVYAAPSVRRRSGLWGRLKNVIQGLDGPLVIGGDFNTIVRVDERTGGNGQLSPDSLDFGEWINESALIDMGYRGKNFTWRRGRVQQNYVAKRLDRVLCSAEARLKWQEARVTHLPFLSSDHTPIYVQLSTVENGNPSRRPFRFEAAWLQHPGFSEMLSSSWNSALRTPEALNGLRSKLK